MSKEQMIKKVVEQVTKQIEDGINAFRLDHEKEKR